MTESSVPQPLPLTRSPLASSRPTLRWFPRRPPAGLASLAQFAALIILASVVLVPLVAAALGGFKELGDLRADPFGLPKVWVWRNYWDMLSGARYWQVLGNSLVIALLTVFLTLALSSMAAFTFAHLHFFGERFLLNYMLLGLLFPSATAILPLFIKIRDLGLLNSHWGIVLPQVAFALGMGILLLRNAFRQLPYELLDAALMDGCGYIHYFFYITLPLSLPILSTVAVIAFDVENTQYGVSGVTATLGASRGSDGPFPFAWPTARSSTTWPWRRRQSCTAGCTPVR